MGLRIELLIGRNTHVINQNLQRDREYFSTYVRFDIWKPRSAVWHLYDECCSSKKDGCYIFDPVINKPLSRDDFGNKLTPVNIFAVIRALRSDLKSVDDRRYHWAQALLKAIYRDVPDAEVILWGYDRFKWKEE